MEGEMEGERVGRKDTEGKSERGRERELFRYYLRAITGHKNSKCSKEEKRKQGREK